ncbi:MAG: four helix bundle protein [Ignavibacteriales bacterium]|nr:four helix bundle protein [Ignavibacteriales bacterium]
MKSRTRTFAVKVVDLVERLDKSKMGDVAGYQVIRSATSVAANYRAVCRSRSKADFVNKLGIVEEEADETLFWLEMLVECKKVKLPEIKPLINEAEQLTKILAASRITAKRNSANM